MSLSFEQARDLMFEVVLAAWPHAASNLLWTDLPSDVPPSKAVWGRAILRHEGGGQASLANANGRRRWERVGTLFVQVFAPVGDGSKQGYRTAQVLVDAFQDIKSSPVWYRNARLNEVGTSGAFEQINVMVNFSYDEVR